jgi:hypothetical protein
MDTELHPAKSFLPNFIGFLCQGVVWKQHSIETKTAFRVGSLVFKRPMLRRIASASDGRRQINAATQNDLSMA